MNVEVRKRVIYLEDVLTEGQRALPRPVRKVVAAAVLKNPYLDGFAEDLSMLSEAGERLAEEFMRTCMNLLERPVEAYGKGGIVGEAGELEHVAAVLHPRFGGPTRALSDGVSILPSVKKRGPMGSVIDIPTHHKRAMLVRSHFDSIEFRVPDAPAADELIVALAVTDGGRPHPRVGGLTERQIVGEDGLR